MRTHQIHSLIIIAVAFMALSCPAEKKPASGEQSPGIAEIPETSEIPDSPEISETPAITGSARDAENAAQIDEAKRIPVREIPEEYAMALENWTRASEYPFNEDSIKTIVYGNGRFVAAGSMRIPLAYSDDGDTWHRVEDTVIDRIFVAGAALTLAYGNGRFVAAAKGDKIVYSDNGETWTLVEDGGLGHYAIEDIVYGNGCFVAVGYVWEQFDGIIGYSSDGETWTLVEDGSLDIDLFSCIAYGNGQFIAGGSKGRAAYSNDGKTWAAIPGSPFEDFDFRIITYGNGRFVARCSIFNGPEMVAYSDDGINWTALSDGPFTWYSVLNIVYANDLFIAVSHSARMAYSIDGETWYSGPEGNGFTIRALEGPGDNLRGIAYGNGRFVIGGGNGARGSSKLAWCEIPAVNSGGNVEVPAEDEADIYIDTEQK
jgi:hypothetical protein